MGTGKYKDEIVFLNNLKTSGYTDNKLVYILIFIFTFKCNRVRKTLLNL